MNNQHKSKNKSKLRFAALIRVSTEKQQTQGESLRTQKQQIEKAVESCGGKVVNWFGGQEHATAGWEHSEVDRLLEFCERQPRQVDAVIVAHQDRWSRDNIASEQGLNRLQLCGVRFFVLGTEHDLNEPTARLYLAMSSSIGAYHAATQKKKSIENRIARANRGLPTAGKLPFGRTFNRKTEKWGVDPAKKAFIEEIAERYLAGESLEKVAIEHGVNHASLHKTLMQRTGPDWSVTFRVDGVVVRDKPLMYPLPYQPFCLLRQSKPCTHVPRPTKLILMAQSRMTIFFGVWCFARIAGMPCLDKRIITGNGIIVIVITKGYLNVIGIKIPCLLMNWKKLSCSIYGLLSETQAG